MSDHAMTLAGIPDRKFYRGHFERSIQSLAHIEEKWPGWLSRLITRRPRLDEFVEGLRPIPDNIKTVIRVNLT